MMEELNKMDLENKDNSQENEDDFEGLNAKFLNVKIIDKPLIKKAPKTKMLSSRSNPQRQSTE